MRLVYYTWDGIVFYRVVVKVEISMNGESLSPWGTVE